MPCIVGTAARESKPTAIDTLHMPEEIPRQVGMNRWVGLRELINLLTVTAGVGVAARVMCMAAFKVDG